MQMYKTVTYKNTENINMDDCKQIVLIAPSGFD